MYENFFYYSRCITSLAESLFVMNFISFSALKINMILIQNSKNLYLILFHFAYQDKFYTISALNTFYYL